MSLISCKNIYLSYENNPVISDLSFSVEAGDYLCIVGENGSGKSTLVKAILGLKETSSGHLHFGEGLKKGEIGYLAQQTTTQKDFPASVYEVVLSGCLSDKKTVFYTKKHKAIAKENMKKLDIFSLRYKCFRELSGGQQQRVLLARAFCATGQLILLDEPIAGLDPMAMTEMYGMIADLNREGVAVVMVSHDVSAAVNYATHILHMSKTTTFFGTTEEYLSTPVGQQFARREGGSYGDWSPKTAWDAPNIGNILDIRAIPDARSVLGARGVSRDKSLTENRRRLSASNKGEGDNV